MANKFSLGTLAVLLAVSPTLFGMESEQNSNGTDKEIVVWQPETNSYHEELYQSDIDKVIFIPFANLNYNDLRELYSIDINNIEILDEKAFNVDEDGFPTQLLQIW